MVALGSDVAQISHSPAKSVGAMHDKRTRVGERARAVLASPERCALFIDIDGTLLGVAPTPDAVSVPAGLVALLEAADFDGVAEVRAWLEALAEKLATTNAAATA